MTSRIRGAVRVIKHVISVLAVLLLLLIVGATIAAYLAVTGNSLALVRFAAAQVGRLVAGQRTQHLMLDVQASPTEGQLTGRATLVVESREESRQRFYFLLNDGLRIRRGRVEGTDKTPRPASIYQLWLLTIVDVGSPVPKGGTVQLTVDYDGAPVTGMFSVASNALNPQRVLLNVDSFWYPSDLQGFFDAEVTATLPATMTVVHNGVETESVARGDLRQTHWTTERPVAGLALVAGQYSMTAREVDGTTYRLYLSPDLQLDTTRLLGFMSDANGTLQQRYGASGFHHVTLFVDRNLRRGFNDGSGLMGLSIRYFRTGDYGFAATAHEIAHNWWGGTVAEKWLTPGTGGEWLVEGLSEFSSLVATEAEFGADALRRRRGEELFDPAGHGVIAQMSVLDNALAESSARDTIYRKGAYVALMLRQKLGDDIYFSGLRQFLERFKLQQATDRDLQSVLQEVSQQNLERYFADWVRSDHLADLSLDANSQSEITVSNLGSAVIPGDIDLWTFKKGDGDQPTRATVHLGDRTKLEADADYAVLDPLLVWADVQRENNRYPRASAPLYVTASPRGDLAVTRGEPFPWMRASVGHIAAEGRTRHTWDFSRGMAEPPSWSPDGSRLIVSYSESPDALPAIVTLAAEGTQRTIGRGTAPAAAADGTIYAGQRDRIVRFAADGSESTVVQRRGDLLERPLPSPDGLRLAYSAARSNRVELRVISRDGDDDHSLLSWDRDRMRYRWAPDGTHLYAIIGGNWDWQIWDIPVEAGSITQLATGAAAIFDLALSPDGEQLGFTAAPELDYPNCRGRLYVLRPSDRTVHTIDVPDTDLGSFAWVSSDTVVAVATKARADQRWILPANRGLKRVRVSDGQVEDMP
ncbi:MAG: M1 family aminopeptidase [Candidatus Binatia bacterium]